jgi:thiamine-phosphate pyrophosphorylase
LLLNKIGIYPIIDIEYLRRVNVEIDSAVEILKKFPVKFLQIRWKKPLSDREFLEIAMGIRKRWRRILIINDRIDIALCVSADGVHLGEDDIPANLARKILPDRAVIGLSVHSIDEVKMANKLKVNYISFGSIFPTETKGVPVPLQGKEMLRKIIEISKHPVVAIGGINSENMGSLLDLSLSGISMISGIFNGDIKENLKKIFEVIKK